MLQSFRNFIDAICYPFRMLARIPSNVISSPRRMLGLSLPMRAALVLFLGLLLIVIGWAIVILTLDGTEQLKGFLWQELPTLLLLVFIIPAVVWYALKLWLEGEPSPFPQIDQAWKAALDEMKKHEINPSETPIFLVLGPSNTGEVSHFMNASNMQFPVVAPQGPAELHVYANHESIYVVCTKSCAMGTLLGGGMMSGESPDAMTPASAGYDPTRTMQVGFGDELSGNQSFATPAGGSASKSSLGPGRGNQTAEVQPFGLGGSPALRPATPAARGGAGGGSVASDIQATMQVGVDPTVAPLTPQKGKSSAPRLDTGVAGKAADKLAYICRCIRRVRDPLAPINGVLCVTPFGLIADGTQDAVNQLQVALKSDISTLRMATRLRCSVTHLVSGMEDEAGFRELIRRVGADRTASQRFGKGFGLWNLPNPDQLEAVVKHACGAFEDWSYLLFREKDGLGRRGNRQLYGLLCRIRLQFMPRLVNLVREGYKLENQSPMLSAREPMLFSGCYFIAAGEKTDGQAFVASVFGKARSEEEDLEWGSEAIGEEKQMQTGVQVLLVLNGVLVALAIAMLIKMNM